MQSFVKEAGIFGVAGAAFGAGASYAVSYDVRCGALTGAVAFIAVTAFAQMVPRLQKNNSLAVGFLLTASVVTVGATHRFQPQPTLLKTIFVSLSILVGGSISGLRVLKFAGWLKE